MIPAGRGGVPVIGSGGTTTIQAADAEGWVVSITPSGGWVPAVIAGRTGVGLSQRMQSFVLDAAENPYNVVEPGKQPRVTLTPFIALKDGEPFLSMAVQVGDTQDQNLLQFSWTSSRLGCKHQLLSAPRLLWRPRIHLRRLLLHEDTPPWCGTSCVRWATPSRSTT